MLTIRDNQLHHPANCWDAGEGCKLFCPVGAGCGGQVVVVVATRRLAEDPARDPNLGTRKVSAFSRVRALAGLGWHGRVRVA